MSVTSGANNRPNFLLQEVCEIWSLSNVGLFTQHTECLWLQFLSTWVSDKCLMHVSVTSGVNFTLSDLKSYRAAFRLFHKIAKRDYYLRHACLSILLSVWNNSAPTGRIFMKYDIAVLFETLSRKFNFLAKLTRITGTLYEDLCTFMIKPRWILLRMKNIWDKCCREIRDKIFDK